MEEKRLVSVTNRDSGVVGYHIPELNVKRKFSVGETKKNIPFEEIQRLQHMDGGDYLLRHLLMVKDQKVLQELDINTEPEYFYTEEDIKKVLLEGTLDQLDDTLTFGVDGVKELVKKLAVELEIPDIRKRNLITEKTGFNISNAINVNQVMAEAAPEVEAEPEKKRKAAPINAEAEPKRKADLPKYNVIEED